MMWLIQIGDKVKKSMSKTLTQYYDVDLHKFFNRAVTRAWNKAQTRVRDFLSRVHGREMGNLGCVRCRIGWHGHVERAGKGILQVGCGGNVLLSARRGRPDRTVCLSIFICQELTIGTPDKYRG